MGELNILIIFLRNLSSFERTFYSSFLKDRFLFYFDSLQAFNKYSENKILETLDPSMEETVDAEIVIKMFKLAIQCAAPVRAERPDMKFVGEQLWSIRANYMSQKKARLP